MCIYFLSFYVFIILIATSDDIRPSFQITKQGNRESERHSSLRRYRGRRGRLARLNSSNRIQQVNGEK